MGGGGAGLPYECGVVEDMLLEEAEGIWKWLGDGARGPEEETRGHKPIGILRHRHYCQRNDFRTVFKN